MIIYKLLITEKSETNWKYALYCFSVSDEFFNVTEKTQYNGVWFVPSDKLIADLQASDLRDEYYDISGKTDAEIEEAIRNKHVEDIVELQYNIVSKKWDGERWVDKTDIELVNEGLKTLVQCKKEKMYVLSKLTRAWIDYEDAIVKHMPDWRKLSWKEYKQIYEKVQAGLTLDMSDQVLYDNFPQVEKGETNDSCYSDVCTAMLWVMQCYGVNNYIEKLYSEALTIEELEAIPSIPYPEWPL